MLQIVLAEDHNIVRNGIKILLDAEQEFHVVGEATDGKEVLEILKKTDKVDLVITDINMPHMDGIQLLKEMKVLNPEIRVIVLSMLDSEEFVSQAFAEGASGYLLKNISSDELIFAIKHVSSGNQYLCSELSIKLLERVTKSSALTPIIDSNIEFSSREVEVLNLIAEGLTNLEMSEKLFLSKRTIEGHRQSLIEKTGSRNTAALIRFAVLNGFVQ